MCNMMNKEVGPNGEQLKKWQVFTVMPKETDPFYKGRKTLMYCT